MKVITIINKHGNEYSTLDYIGWLKFQLDYIKMKDQPEYYIRNEYGGCDRMDSFGNTINNPFQNISKLLRDIIVAQCDRRENV